MTFEGSGGGGTPRVQGRQLPPPPPQGASGQQLIVKGTGLRSPWALKAPEAPRTPKAPEGNFCALCTPPLSSNPTLTLTPTLALSLVRTLTSNTRLGLVLVLGSKMESNDVATKTDEQNHLAEVVRSKPRRPVYRGKRHVPALLGLFGAIRVPYLKGLNRLFDPL